MLEALDILPLEKPVDEYYGKIRALLAQAGQPIGGNDLFIAAHALALNLTLVSANIREFPGCQAFVWKTGWQNDRYNTRHGTSLDNSIIYVSEAVYKGLSFI